MIVKRQEDRNAHLSHDFFCSLTKGSNRRYFNGRQTLIPEPQATVIATCVYGHLNYCSVFCVWMDSVISINILCFLNAIQS